MWERDRHVKMYLRIRLDFLEAVLTFALSFPSLNSP